MKRIASVLIVLSALIIVGCTTGSFTDQPQKDGYITLNIKKADVLPMSLSEPTHIKIIVRHENGFSVIKDVPVTLENEVVEIKVPAIAGYRVDALSYERNALKSSSGNDYHRLLKYDTAVNIRVRPDKATIVSLTLKPIEIEVDFPEEVVVGELYMFSVTVPDVLSGVVSLAYRKEPWQGTLSEMPSDFADVWLSVDREGTKRHGYFEHNVSWFPFDYEEEGYVYLYFSGAIDRSLVGLGWELYKVWSPDVDLGAEPLAIPVKISQGRMDIGISY